MYCTWPVLKHDLRVKTVFTFSLRAETFSSVVFRYISALFDSLNMDLRRGTPQMWWSFLPFTSDLQQTKIISCKFFYIAYCPVSLYWWSCVLQFIKNKWSGWKTGSLRTAIVMTETMRSRSRGFYQPVARCTVQSKVMLWIIRLRLEFVCKQFNMHIFMHT